MHLRSPTSRWLAVAAAVVLYSGQAQAQSQLDLQIFRPSMDSGGNLNVNTGATGGHLTARGGIWFNYAHRLMRSEINGTDVKLGDVVGNRLDGTAIATLSLFRRLEIGVAMPFNIYQNGLNTNLIQDVLGKTNLSSSGVGDLRLMLKGGILTETKYRPAVALVVEGSVPTGDAREFRGEPSFTLTPNVAVSKRIGPQWQAIVNLGYNFRNENARIYRTNLQDEIIYRVGATYAIKQRGGPSIWGLMASIDGATPTNDIFGLGSRPAGNVRNYMQLTFAGTRRFQTSVGNFRILAGIGTGLLPGYGSPLIRGILGFDYLNREPFDDDDHDGIINVDDKCPGQPEDLDDFEDQDGCPELDNDNDGIEDVDDECPNEPEDKDGYEDFDGCPEVSELDADLDGVSDANDKCPDSKEDFDGFEDEDGCLDADDDGDGLTDLNDLCPREFEDQATSTDHDGCPDGMDTESLATLTQTNITTAMSIEFEGNALAKSAQGVLNQVALLMREHNEVRELTIEVAPLTKQAAAKGQAQRRAQAVADYLVARGVDKGRLVASGLSSPGAMPGSVKLQVTKRANVAAPAAVTPAPSTVTSPTPAPVVKPAAPATKPATPVVTPAPTASPSGGALSAPADTAPTKPVKGKAKGKSTTNPDGTPKTKGKAKGKKSATTP